MGVEKVNERKIRSENRNEPKLEENEERALLVEREHILR